jgi:hypothetical protein
VPLRTKRRYTAGCLLSNNKWPERHAPYPPTKAHSHRHRVTPSLGQKSSRHTHRTGFVVYTIENDLYLHTKPIVRPRHNMEVVYRVRDFRSRRVRLDCDYGTMESPVLKLETFIHLFVARRDAIIYPSFINKQA